MTTDDRRARRKKAHPPRSTDGRKAERSVIGDPEFVSAVEIILTRTGKHELAAALDLPEISVYLKRVATEAGRPELYDQFKQALLRDAARATSNAGESQPGHVLKA